MTTIDGRVAAVTGAGSGIGRGLALALARRGCTLALSDIDEQGLAETVELVSSEGAADLRTTRLDVADRRAVEAWADDTADSFGGVNLIFNNAGVALSAPVASMAR